MQQCHGHQDSHGSAAKLLPAEPATKPASHQEGCGRSDQRPVGTTFTVKSTDSNGNPIAYTVTLLRFVPDATPDNSFDTAPAGQAPGRG